MEQALYKFIIIIIKSICDYNFMNELIKMRKKHPTKSITAYLNRK